MSWWAWLLIGWLALSVPVAVLAGRMMRGPAPGRRHREHRDVRPSRPVRDLPSPRRDEESA